MGTLYVPLTVRGTVPVKFKPPSKNAQVRLTALLWIGVITYARGAKSCADRKGKNPAPMRMNDANLEKKRIAKHLPISLFGRKPSKTDDGGDLSSYTATNVMGWGA
jgi:hypothetical protein